MNCDEFSKRQNHCAWAPEKQQSQKNTPVDLRYARRISITDWTDRNGAVALGVGPMPVPRGGDDVFEPCPARLPAQLAYGFVRSRHQAGRVSRPARLLDGLDGLACGLLAGADDLKDRVTLAVAQIEETRLARGQGQDVRLGKVHDVDIIAHAGAVGCRVVGAEDRSNTSASARRACSFNRRRCSTLGTYARWTCLATTEMWRTSLWGNSSSARRNGPAFKGTSLSKPC